MALGLTDFDGTVGGNISGTSDLAPLDQQADMIVEWMPDAKKVGLLYCSAEANSQYQVDEVQKYLEAKGVTATQYAFSDSNDLSSVCQKAADENDALYVPTDNTVAANTGIVDGICRPAKKPVFAGEEGICAGCGVATLSISYYDLGYTTGEMAVKILKGEADVSDHAHRVHRCDQEVQQDHLRRPGPDRSRRLRGHRGLNSSRDNQTENQRRRRFQCSSPLSRIKREVKKCNV